MMIVYLKHFMKYIFVITLLDPIILFACLSAFYSINVIYLCINLIFLN